MPKVIVALLVTAVAVVLLAGYDTKPPRTVNPNSALKPRPKAAPKLPPGARAAVGPASITPFSVIQVQATVQHGKLIGVKTDGADRRRPSHAGPQRPRRAAAARLGAEGGER